MQYDLEVTVEKIQGKCGFGYKVGDKVYFKGPKTKGNMCASALMATLPRIFAMRFGAEFPWTKDKDVDYATCPDPENPVTFKIRRIRKK
jgi:uncharacterized repeat protein (TIGR04076 family)